MNRLQMPGSDFVGDELIECIKELVKVDSDWIPYGEGYSLYLRPNVIAMHEHLGLAAPTSTMLYVVSVSIYDYSNIRKKAEGRWNRYV